MNIEQQLKIVRNIFIDLPKQFDLVHDEYKKADQETQDLLHALELGNLNAIEMTKVAKELKEVRKRRRHLKDELEVLREVRNFATNGKLKEYHIDMAIGKVRTIYEKRERRTYKMRVRSDLQELVMEGSN